MTLYHLRRQAIILLTDQRNILFPNGIGLLRRRHHRLHGNLLKAQIRKMQNILAEIKVIPSESSSHIIIILIPAFGRFLELGNNQLIASLSIPERTHLVMNPLPAVNAQNHIAHFPIGKFHYLVIQEHAVGGQGKPKLLIMKLLLLSAVSHQILYYLPVHQRLTAKEVYLQISPASGILNQKIQCLLSHLIAHQRPASMVFTLFRKAILTGQIAVMGNMQAQSFHYGGPLFKVNDFIFIGILRKENALLFQLFNILQDLPDLFLWIPVLKLIHNLLSAFFFIERNCFIRQLIYHMNCAAVYIQHNIVAVISILMDHLCPLSRRIMRVSLKG